MSECTFELLHSPQVLHQAETCRDLGERHPGVHRQFTGLVCHVCNCGYNSGWVHKSTLPLGSDFIMSHLPPGVNQGDLSRPTRTFDPEAFDE